ncbi:MAG TPA: hypothetical protein PLM63_04095 [bacterium]|nr:hypothetical protein [bacterium]
MDLLNFNTIELHDPNINIELTIDENDFLKRIGMKKNNLGFYNFLSHITDEHIYVQVFINFKENLNTIQIVTIGSESLIDKATGIIYSDTKYTNLLGDFVINNFGKPTLLTRIFSKLNKPFYIHKWKYKDINITHKYQDSHDGLQESLIFEIHK